MNRIRLLVVPTLLLGVIGCTSPDASLLLGLALPLPDAMQFVLQHQADFQEDKSHFDGVDKPQDPIASLDGAYGRVAVQLVEILEVGQLPRLVHAEVAEVLKFDPATQRITYYRTRNYLPTENINAMINDESPSFVWFDCTFEITSDTAFDRMIDTGDGGRLIGNADYQSTYLGQFRVGISEGNGWTTTATLSGDYLLTDDGDIDAVNKEPNVRVWRRLDSVTR